MFRPGKSAGYGVRLRSGLVTHNNSAKEVCSVQIKGIEGAKQHHGPLSLERASLTSGTPRKQCASMLASMASLCPSSLKAAKGSISVTRSASLEERESSAKSGGSAKQLAMSEGDSGKVCAKELLVRSSSGVSMVTSEADCKEKEEQNLAMIEGDNLQESGDDNGWSESEASATQESETSSHPIAKEYESVATTWTDDKHSSYLNSIEATFVRNLYKQGFPAMDVNGKLGPADDCEHDCVESRPRGLHGCCTSDPTEFFELLQGGHEKAYYHPQSLDPSLSVPPAVLDNPWIQHFKQKVTNVTSTGVPLGSTTPEVTLNNTKELLTSFTPEHTNASNGKKPVEELEKDRVTDGDQAHAEDEALEYKGMDNTAEDSDMTQGLRIWHSRLQSQGQVSLNVACRKDNSIWLAKRPSDYEHGNANAFHAKRHKSTQQDLAWKDLEMLNEYVAGQVAQNELAAGLVTTKSELPDQAIIHHQLKPLRSVSQPTLDICSSEHKPPNSEENKPLGQVYSLLEHAGWKGVEVKSVARDRSSLICSNTPSYCTTSQMTHPSLSEILASALEGQHRKLEPKTELNGVNCKALLPGGSNDYVQLLDEKVDGIAHKITILTEQSLIGKHGQGPVGEDAEDTNVQTQQWLEGAEATECNRQVSPSTPLRGRTWTWSMHGLRRHLHEPLQLLNSKR